MPLLFSTSIVLLFLALVNADVPINVTNGLYGGQQSCSVGGKAVCTTSIVEIAGTLGPAMHYQVLRLGSLFV